MRVAALLAMFGLSGLLPVAAHEIGALRAKATFAADGTFRIDAVVEVPHLPAGVTAGQLAVIGLAYLVLGRWFGAAPWYRRWITVPASALIAAVGLYWTVQRVLL